MLKRILDGRGPLGPLLGELGPHVLVVGPCGSMFDGSSSHLWSLRVPLVLFVLSWNSSRSSVDIRVMSALEFLIILTELIETKLEFDVKDYTFNKVTVKK